jgi:hypothetical protein
MSQNALSSLSVQQLKRAVAIKERIARLEKKLAGLLGGPDTVPAGKSKKPRRKMSAAGRASMSAAAKARWAKVKAAKK